ncbi:MAG TPA: hypothetical protein VMF05_05490 [Stellaceae bacterium]|nr:hypothetical protein [Stellaceae bacterium]
MPIPLVLVAMLALGPLDTGQQARLAAWLEWGVAYRDCYAPAPFSLRIDEGFTARCIETTLRGGEAAGPPEERAATEALIAATPRLVALLNAPAARPGRAPAAGVDPPPPAPPGITGGSTGRSR